MALLSLLRDWTDYSRLVTVTIDHGFREGISSLEFKNAIESAEEAAKVHEWVSSMKIEHIIKRIDWVEFRMDIH